MKLPRKVPVYYTNEFRRFKEVFLINYALNTITKEQCTLPNFKQGCLLPPPLTISTITCRQTQQPHLSMEHRFPAFNIQMVPYKIHHLHLSENTSTRRNKLPPSYTDIKPPKAGKPKPMELKSSSYEFPSFFIYFYLIHYFQSISLQ